MSEPKRLNAWGKEVPDGDYIRYDDYARLKKEYDDLEYCRGHVPYAQHRSAVDKWTELFHKTADNFDKVVAENARLKAEVERLKHRAEGLREAGDELWFCIRHGKRLTHAEVQEAVEDWQDMRAKQ